MEATTFVLFGATGDLAKRKIYPALYNLFLDGKLPQEFRVIGLGRRPFSDETFQASVEHAVHTFSRRKAEETAEFKQFVQSFSYCPLNIDNSDDYKKLLQLVQQYEAGMSGTPNRMFYLSVGPEFFATIADNIKASGLGDTKGWKRLVIEKPFGHDLPSAQQLNAKLSKSFSEDEIYRIDHYLGKPMIQKLEILQQSNPVLQALWSNRYISNVQISASETVGVEERAGYYDHVGAIRDMFQNHMLQMLMMLTLHLPENSTPEVVRFKKKTILEALEPLHRDNIAAHVVRGQYTAGSIAGKEVASYTNEPGISSDSMNDTYVAAKLEIDDPFWRGVPFYIRTGKRMKEKYTRIIVEFKEAFKQTTKATDSNQIANLLIFEISPNEGITFQLNSRDPQNKDQFKPIYIDFHSNGAEAPEAYESLIHDALNGDPTFFAHWDEVELSWKWVQPILNAFADNSIPLHYYPAGSNGPAAADELLAKNGHHWWLDSEPDQHKQQLKGEQQYVYTNH
ncbi:glucose-6-phosphate 1-dehydrogenase [Paenibacillus montaniterrae]|uniref:Glucose-6-phosphate 1-dehydrogenase n=1 Tax=Paenibacillus montaniterrae TaxID=429341 RepID=A0A919YMM6_9BACL|nr:glucose-6-phosphate dehydrogenase [Paenibacillus montaniterrae]GIP15972.1 glucose-6-phosphate 1-dehydrogenase [Paenibacillus montaniterrae]